jgi:hypothetical protein
LALAASAGRRDSRSRRDAGHHEVLTKITKITKIAKKNLVVVAGAANQRTVPSVS